MGTLADALVATRLRIKENQVEYFSDTELILLGNSIVRQFYALMKAHECKFLTSIEEIILTSDSEYTIASFNGIVFSEVFTESGESIPYYSAPFDTEFSYTEEASGIKFYNKTGLEGNSISVRYWDAIPSINTTAISTDDLPWAGIWDEAIIRALVVECQEIRERDNSRTAIWAQQAVDDALNTVVTKFGTISRRVWGTLDV